MQSQPESPPSTTVTRELEPRRDPELWFDDGNVVIVAGAAAFRVHTGVLSRHSEVFQDTFGVPRPALPAPSDVFDGQPVVHVSDSAHDFKQLLCMLYDGAKFMPPDEPVQFAVLAAVARLGHKYHIEWILKEATRRLRSIFPHTYEDWLKSKGRSNHLVVVPHHPFPYIEAVNLIRLIGETKMLPLAIYECCQDPLQVLKGAARADGTVETLDLPTLGLCISAHTNLIQRQAMLNADVFCSGPSECCPQAGVCRAAMEEVYRKVCGSAHFFLRGRVLHSSIRLALGKLERWKEVCSLCTLSLRERERAAERAVWEELPMLLGVDSEVDGWNQNAA